MKKMLKTLVLACLILNILACSIGNLFSNQTQTTPASEVVLPHPTALPPNIFREGGPPPLPDKIVITSRTSYTSGEEINSFISSNVISDPGALDVLNWARENGYYSQNHQPGEAEKAVFSINLAIYAVVFLGDASQPIAFLRFATPEGKSLSMMARMEGDQNNPVLVLFSRDSQVRYSKDGVKIDRAWNNSEILPVNLRISQHVFQNSCDYSSTSGLKDRERASAVWENWKNCIELIGIQEKTSEEGKRCITALDLARTGWIEGGKNKADSLLLAVLNCGFSAVFCAYGAQNDYPPLLIAKVNKIENGFVSRCTETGKVGIYQAYQVDVSTQDDWKPLPDLSRVIEYLPSDFRKVYSATDCAGQTTSITVSTPHNPSQVDDCSKDEICDQVSFNFAHCQTTGFMDPLAIPPAVQPQTSATVKEGTYTGKQCKDFETHKESNGIISCTGDMDETFTLKSNKDGTITATPPIRITLLLNPNTPTIFQPEKDGSFVWRYISDDKSNSYEVHLIFKDDGLTWIEDWYKGSSHVFNFESHFDLVSQ